MHEKRDLRCREFRMEGEIKGRTRIMRKREKDIRKERRRIKKNVKKQRKKS